MLSVCSLIVSLQRCNARATCAVSGAIGRFNVGALWFRGDYLRTCVDAVEETVIERRKKLTNLSFRFVFLRLLQERATQVASYKR